MSQILLFATLLALIAAQCSAQLVGTTSVWPSTCSTTRSAIYYTSGASTFTVASCAPSTSYITLEATCPGSLPSITPQQNASLAPATIYITQEATTYPSQTVSEAATTYLPTTVFISGQATCPTVSSPNTVYTSQPSALPVCDDTSADTSASSTCRDTYGNAFNVTYGTRFIGDISQRTSAADVDSCLTSCDHTTGCLAVNFVNETCSLLSSVTGAEIVAYGNAMRAVAAMRPSGVATIYTTVQATAAPATATTTVVSYQDRTITAGGAT
ncbi:hypothetical protein LTR56_002715 [Elasticomyces elasticus]|nr:hypothetical protein LTR56_002715 [Elasticomyces elasticus]KAK3666830.1 hypothetical protein LTR22_002417 [Elasticomyces elasticus]KAK4918854.1 hypothetical protein LTR49_013485 [Elasticomyces elasticus]KAK5758771.1 hypothetical protein LTS12_011165 [Elasticomyces elasticus]